MAEAQECVEGSGLVVVYGTGGRWGRGQREGGVGSVAGRREAGRAGETNEWQV